MGTSRFPVWPRGIAHPQLQRFFETLRKRVFELEETVLAGGVPWTSLTNNYLPKYDSGGDELVDSVAYEDTGWITTQQMRVGGAVPRLEIYDSDYSFSDARRWRFYQTGAQLRWAAVTEDQATVRDFMSIVRLSGDYSYPTQIKWYPTNFASRTVQFTIGSTGHQTSALLEVNTNGNNAGFAVYNSHIYLHNAGSPTAANIIQWGTSTVFGKIVGNYLSGNGRMEYFSGDHTHFVLDSRSLVADAEFVIRMHNTSGSYYLSFTEGAGLGWDKDGASWTNTIGSSDDILSLPLANNTSLTWRNAGDTADINVLKVDASDDTVLMADTSDQILFYSGATLAMTISGTGTIQIENTLTMNTADIYMSTGYAVRDSSDADHAYLPRPAADQALLRSAGNVIIQLDSDATSSGNYFQIRHDASTYSGGSLLWQIDETGAISQYGALTITGNQASEFVALKLDNLDNTAAGFTKLLIETTHADADPVITFAAAGTTANTWTIGTDGSTSTDNFVIAVGQNLSSIPALWIKRTAVAGDVFIAGDMNIASDNYVNFTPADSNTSIRRTTTGYFTDATLEFNSYGTANVGGFAFHRRGPGSEALLTIDCDSNNLGETIVHYTLVVGTDPGGTKTVRVAADMLVGTDLEIDGSLDHDGSTVGFYGTTPVAQSSAYTVSNGSTDRALDVTGDSLAQVAAVLGTLIGDLQALGLIG